MWGRCDAVATCPVYFSWSIFGSRKVFSELGKRYLNETMARTGVWHADEPNIMVNMWQCRSVGALRGSLETTSRLKFFKPLDIQFSRPREIYQWGAGVSWNTVHGVEMGSTHSSLHRRSMDDRKIHTYKLIEVLLHIFESFTKFI